MLSSELKSASLGVGGVGRASNAGFAHQHRSRGAGGLLLRDEGALFNTTPDHTWCTLNPA